MKKQRAHKIFPTATIDIASRKLNKSDIYPITAGAGISPKTCMKKMYTPIIVPHADGDTASIKAAMIGP